MVKKRLAELLVNDAARVLEVHPLTVIRLCNDGKLACRRVGSRGFRVIRASDLERYKKVREKAAAVKA